MEVTDETTPQENIKNDKDVADKPAVVDKQPVCNMVITRNSLRPPCKRQRTRSTTFKIPEAKKNHSIVEGEGEVTSTNNEDFVKRKKCRRQWEQWSDDDQERFFQGLAEFGKDYAKIEIAMKKRIRGKVDTRPKTQEQIRHFYHRTWAKISKNLKLQQELDPKKACRREIHYMICLGELRKKGALTFGPKVMKQLDELVTQGVTVMRCKMRNIRVRPPNRFLRKLYNNSIADMTLPKHITIEFLPYTNSAFNFVQKYAFNPRLRFTNVNINSKFSEIFEMFDKRFTDLYSSDALILHIYPIQTLNKDSNEFARLLVEAKDRIDTHAKNQDTPIVLEEATKLPTCDKEDESVTTVEKETFPKIFGKDSDVKVRSIDAEHIKPFPGYWTYQSAELISLRTLYVAVGENEMMKFKYDWKKSEVKQSANLHTESFQFLKTLCVAENKSKKELQKVRPPQHIAPKTLPVVVPGIIQKDNILPLRPRPGRRPNYKNRVVQKRFIVPRFNGSNNKLLNNAVAVNLIPQPQQLLQFAHMLPDKTKLVNSGLSTKSTFLQQFGPQIQRINPEVVVTEATSSSQIICEEVLEEGCNKEDYRSLTHLLSSLVKETHAPQVEPTTSNLSAPKSPNFDWLTNGESVDISMSSFNNVDQQQQLQQKLATNALYQQNSDFKLKNVETDSCMGLKATNDPTLSEFNTDTNNSSLFGIYFK